MPLVRFDLIEGRTPQELRSLMDTTHEVLVAVFGIPPMSWSPSPPTAMPTGASDMVGHSF